MGKQGYSCSEFVSHVIDRTGALDRVQKYPSILAHFPDKVLRKYSAIAPFYCHYMLWRLAVLTSPQLERLDELLRCAQDIPGWSQESKSLLNGRDFGEFWSLVWQLQVAEFLLARAFQLEWPSAGPDLTATRGANRLFVECVVPRKQYSKFVFLQELLRQIDPRLKVVRQVFLPLQVVSDADFAAGLDEIIGGLTAPGRLGSLVYEAQSSYPVMVPLPDSWTGIHLYFEGADARVYRAGVLPQGGGNPNAYLQAMLEEVVRGKQGSNYLSDSHPNVLLVNLLLDDLQLGHLVGQLGAPLIRNAAIDELAWGAVGIDAAIRSDSLTCFRHGSLSTETWNP